MRILYHHRSLADGAEGVHIAAMVAAFRNLGHEVLVTGLAVEADGVCGTRSRTVERLRSVVPGGVFEAASIGANVPDYFRTRRSFERFHPDLLYTRHARNDIAALSLAHRLNVPSVLEVNVLFAAPQYQQFEPLTLKRTSRALERRALRLATVVVAVSSPLARQIRAEAREQVVTLPNGADPDMFDPRRVAGDRIRARYGLTGALAIGWTGIVREWHGLELLLHAVGTLPSAILLIVGDGPARPALQRRVEQMGLKDRVVMTGRVPHEEIAAYVAAMDIAVVADEKTGVASPMKLLEYMSMGRAVLAPRADNIRDLIEDEVDGLLFEPGDANDCADALRRLAEDAPLRHALGARARTKIEVDRNWHRIAEAVLTAVRRDAPGSGRSGQIN